MKQPRMDKCPRCQRYHTGLCGVPAGVALGFGARLGGVRTRDVPSRAVPGRPKTTPLSTKHLEAMLTEAREHYCQVSDMLKVVPPEMPEYAELMDRESKLEHLIKQIEGQIAARKGVKC